MLHCETVFKFVYRYIVVLVTDFKPDKTDKQNVQQTNGACLSPSGELPPAPSLVPPVDNCRPERPSTLAPGKLTRRLLCYHNDNPMPDTACKLVNVNNLTCTVLIFVKKNE